MSLETTIDIIKWVLGGLGMACIWLFNFYVNYAKKMVSVEQRLNAEETLSAHFIKTGENIKEQLANHDLIVNELRSDIRHMKETQERILNILENAK